MILTSILGLIFFAGFLLLCRNYYVKRKWRRLLAEKYNAVRPLIAKLNAKEAITETEIRKISEDPSLRIAVFRILEVFGKKDLFPDVYFTCEKGAESFLVNWLEFPTELGTAPDKITLLTKVTLKEPEALDYYVFKFIASSPRWAARDWMIGTCGPYRTESQHYDTPRRIFSNFNTLGSVSPEDEAKWVHHNISQERQVD